MDEFPVKVYIYDISKGMARAMSQAFLGKQIDGIWHTGIVAYNQEFYFGGMGIESCPPGGTILGAPDTVCDLGATQIPFDMFMDYLQDQASSAYKPERYHLLEHNCNTFSAEVAQFLTGTSIPAYITNLPQEVLSTPFGAMLKPFIDSMSVQPQGGQQLFPGQQNSASQVSSSAASSSVPASSTVASSSSSNKDTDDVKQSSINEQSKQDSHKDRGPSVVYSDSSVRNEYAGFKSSIGDVITAAEVKLLDEINEYISTDTCSWSLGRSHVELIGKLIGNSHIKDEQKRTVVSMMRLALLREDTQMLLSTDLNNSIAKFLNTFESLNQELRTETVKMCVNCCSQEPGLDWATKTSEWYSGDQVTCNRRVMTRLCAAAVLDDSTTVLTPGAVLADYLTARKGELEEDAAVEIGSALLQCLTKDGATEDTAYHSLCALYRCMKMSRQVVDLSLIMGIDISKYRTLSRDLESVCSDIQRILQS